MNANFISFSNVIHQSDEFFFGNVSLLNSISRQNDKLDCGCFFLWKEPELSYSFVFLSLSIFNFIFCFCLLVHLLIEWVHVCVCSVLGILWANDKLFRWFGLVSCREWNIFSVWCEYEQLCECVTLNRSDRSSFWHLHSLCDVNQCVFYVDVCMWFTYYALRHLWICLFDAQEGVSSSTTTCNNFSRDFHSLC